jgi:hypothetical protein
MAKPFEMSIQRSRFTAWALAGKSRQRQFSSRAEGAARLNPYSSSKTRGDSLPAGCIPYVAVLKMFGG